MKTKTTRISKMLLFIFFGMACMFSISCSPEDGRDGRDGINGTNGIDGTDGQNGEQGEPGEDGNANIEVSDWIPIQFDHVDLALEMGRMYIEIPNTQEFTENGGIAMMFLKQQNPNEDDFGITSLPYATGDLYLYYVFGDQTTPYGFEGFTFYANWIGQDVTQLESGPFSLRYVLIHGAEGRSAKDITKMSYKEIIEEFDLK